VPQSWFGHFYALGTAMNGIVLTAVTNQLRSQQVIPIWDNASPCMLAVLYSLLLGGST